MGRRKSTIRMVSNEQPSSAADGVRVTAGGEGSDLSAELRARTRASRAFQAVTFQLRKSHRLIIDIPATRGSSAGRRTTSPGARPRLAHDLAWRSMPHAKIASTGRTLYYERGGAQPSSAPCLLFIDGTGSDLRDGSGQRRIASLGQKGFDVVVYDHRGHGLSADPADTLTGAWTMDDFADDAADLITTLGIKQALVVGWSFGGMVAQHLAVRRPELVLRLVLACTSAGGAAGSSYPLHELEDLPAAERATKLVELLDTRKSNPTAADVEDSVNRKGAEHARLASTPGAVVGKALQLAARRGHDAAGGLRQLKCRALIIGGEFDGVAPLPRVRALAELIAGSRLCEFGGGHLLLKCGEHEQPAWQAIVEFLQEASKQPLSHALLEQLERMYGLEPGSGWKQVLSAMAVFIVNLLILVAAMDLLWILVAGWAGFTSG